MARRRRRSGSKAAYDALHGPGAYERDVYPGHGRVDPYTRKTPTLAGSAAHHAATSGMLAKFNGTCERCPDPIVAGKDRIVPRGSGVIHVGCASGADDE